jgi:hypothetical protein
MATMTDDRRHEVRRMTDFDPTDPRLITLGEVFRNVSDLRKEIASLRNEVSNLKFVTMERYLADQAAASYRVAQMEQRLDRQDERQTWSFRLVVGAIVGSVVAAIVPILLVRAFM